MEDLYRISNEAGPIDVVIFSGDLTQTGSAEEFSALTAELQEIWELFGKAGQQPALFAVPGNHDLVRPSAKDARVKLLKFWSSDPAIVKEFWEEENNQYIELVRTSFSNYMKWKKELPLSGIPFISHSDGIIPGDISASVQVNGLSVGLVGLNSSFLQLDGGDFEGKLALDLRQLNGVTNSNPPGWCNGHDVNFLVTHHPVSWFSGEVQKDFHTEIYPSGRFTAHLFGHMHDAELTTIYRGGDSGRRSFQSTSLFGMEYLADNSTERVHGYSVGKISFSGNDGQWKLWPRVAYVNRRSSDRKIKPDHDNFTIVAGEEYQQENLIRNSSSKSITIASERPADLETSVSETIAQWSDALKSAEYSLPEQDQHIVIRPLQQQACAENIRQKKISWVCADWGLGREGFLWSLVKRIGRTEQQVYRIDLGNYTSRSDFLNSFNAHAGCSFQDFCKALAAKGPAILLLDESPVTVGDYVGKAIERDAEDLAKMVSDFCPHIVIILLSRTVPKDHRIGIVSLEPLDEADTRTYLFSHPDSTSEVKTKYAVSEIYRFSEGLPGKIDRLLKTLRVVNLSELVVTNSEISSDMVEKNELVPMSLVKAVSELSSSVDPKEKRAFLLLKILSLLPHGESLQRLKRVDSSYPIFYPHAEELLDRDLIQVRSSTSLIGIEEDSEDRVKVLVAQRPVRDYVLSILSEREINVIVKKAVSLYFGDSWREGNAVLRKMNGSLTSDDGSLLENPHSLVMKLLANTSLWETPGSGYPVINLCQIYCSALLRGKHYRNCATVCRDVLAMVPEQDYESNRLAIEVLLAKSLRMLGEHEEARSLFEKILSESPSREIKSQILLAYALCLQSLDDERAIDVANEVIDEWPNTEKALQAKSIILEMEGEEVNRGHLLNIESEARKLGFNTAANNLVLSRAKRLIVGDSEDLTSHLRKVYVTATVDGDFYNASRASVKLAEIALNKMTELTSIELINLIKAYQYFYSERFSGLFLSAHESLWNYFESRGDVRNLLSLFRHSSFIWRLHGEEIQEGKYIERLVSKARSILSSNILSADQNTAYFVLRASSKKIGDNV